jgi:peptidoglycan/LPS O-acetylase OafA/YrhL
MAEAPPRDAGGPAPALEYVPQINTLRAIAVGLVFLDHYLHRSVLDGVLLFFTISGFLITKILLSYRDEVDRGVSKITALRVFYIRRTLRIFPAYYLLLLVMIAAGMTHYMAIWHLTYTTNIWSAMHNAFAPDGGHFWTLAVEEQFYLLWPLVILTAPRRWLLWIMLAAIASSLVFRAVALYYDWGLARRVLTVGNLYSLGGGALLGWVHYLSKSQWIALLRRFGWLSFLALPVLAIDHPVILAVVRPIVLTLMSMYLIDRCTIGYKGWIGWFMSLPPLLYLGTISYGLYLCHFFVEEVMGSPFGGRWGGLPDAALWTVASIALASASWFLFERPINNLKSRFRLREKKPAAPGAANAMAASNAD